MSTDGPNLAHGKTQCQVPMKKPSDEGWKGARQSVLEEQQHTGFRNATSGKRQGDVVRNQRLRGLFGLSDSLRTAPHE